jgi:outer membrane protein assembly factor BamB
VRRRIWFLVALALVLLLGTGAGVAYWLVHRPVADIRRGAQDPFTSQPGSDPGDGLDTDPQHPAYGPAWPVYGRSASRTRDASELTDIAPPFRAAWARQMGFLEYPPSYDRGVLYLATDAGVVSAFDVFNGKLLWRRRFGVDMAGQPAVVGGVLYISNRHGDIYALDTKNGHTRWRVRTGERMESVAGFGGGKLFVPSAAGHKVRALDLRNGRILWTYRTSGDVKDGPALVDGRLYFGDYSGVVYCVRASDGKQIWRTATHGLAGGYSSGTFYATPAVAYGRVYISNTDGKVYSLVAATGAISWTYTLPDWAYGSPAASGGRVFATSYDGTVVALDARTGTALWRHLLPARSLSSPTVIGPLVYVADLGQDRTGRGRLYAYNPATGALKWSFKDGKYSSVIAAAGRLVVAGSSKLYVLKPIR